MFFVNTDYTKDIQRAKIYLAKPNKTVISHIHEKQDTNLSIKLGNIYELSFSIPHFINGEHSIEKNPHTESIREKMLLMVKLSGMTEWFIVDSIEEDGSDSDIFNVTAFSLGYELSHKRIGSYNGEGKSCRAMASDVLESSSWNVGDIDVEIQYRTIELTTEDNESKRTLEISGNALDAIFQIAEAFGAVPIFNSNNKTISFRSLEKIGTFKGLTVNYGKLLSSINRSRTTDELATRMYAYGYDDLTIAGVNPTGQMYIEDFSFFLYPFERDSNKNVVKSSYFMSDELCHAILNHKELIQQHSPQIKLLMSDVLNKQSVLQTEKTRLFQLEIELQSIQYRLDTAKAVEDNTLISQIQIEETNKKAQINIQESLINNLEADLLQSEDTIENLRGIIASDAGFTSQLYNELNYYIIEKEWRDDRYIDAQELYDNALEKFIELREPKVVITVDIDNLFEIIDEQYYWDKLELGDLIKIKYPQMDIEYMAQIIEINFDFEGGTIGITIANTEKTGNEMDRLKELLSKSQTASTILDNNKYKWDKVTGIEDEVYTLLNSEWDANKRKITAGANNQIQIGNRGIIITSPDNPDEIVIMQSGIIALSKDGGDTWKTAIKPDGVVAERLIGRIIIGQELKIGNRFGTLEFDENGFRVKMGSIFIDDEDDNNLVDRWQSNADYFDDFKSDGKITPLEKLSIKNRWTEIESRYSANVTKIQNYYNNAGVNLQFVTNYHSKYNELRIYLFETPMSEYPLLHNANMLNTTNINPTEFDAKFRNYDNALVELEKQLDLRSLQLAEEASQASSDAQDRIDEVMSEMVYKIELHSSNGIVFRNNIINTTITARVYRGGDDITSILLNSSFIWRKYNKDGVEDTQWFIQNTGVGNVIAVTEQDIQQKATFKCDVEI